MRFYPANVELCSLRMKIGSHPRERKTESRNHNEKKKSLSSFSHAKPNMFSEETRRDETDERIDIVAIAFTLLHGSEFKFLVRNLEMGGDTATQNLVLSLIDQVVRAGKAALQIGAAPAASTEPGLQQKQQQQQQHLLTESLYVHFVRSALPHIHRVMAPANLARQGLQHFGSCASAGGSCIASRIFIASKHGASNPYLLRHVGITACVRVCEVPPKQGGGLDFFSSEPECFLDAGFADDDNRPLPNLENVLAFATAHLAASPKNKCLIHCAAGRHRSAWTCAALLAAIAVSQSQHVIKHRQKMLGGGSAVVVALPAPCACLVEKTRFHKSLAFSAAEIVKKRRPFADFSHASVSNLEKWTHERLGVTGAGQPNDSDLVVDDDDAADNQ